jgi:type IV secretory pathway VirB4 component
MTGAELVEASRDVALVLHRMCAGDLAGMFDGPTTLDLDPGSPLVVLDLSEVYRQHREALPLVMTCATAWLQATIARADAARRYVVVDEAWALLADVSTARWLQQSYKLARAHGVANIAVLHRFSDLTAAGSAGSETVSLAHGLLADAGTRVVYAQPHSELADTEAVLGLTGTEVELLPHLPQGTGLWRIGPRSFVVEHRRSDAEIRMTDTDARMTGRRP